MVNFDKTCSVRIDVDIVKAARAAAVIEDRTVAAVLRRWIRAGQSAEVAQ